MNMANITAAGPSARDYCSETNTGETLWGSADPVDVWLCMEYRPVWKAKAVADNALAENTRNWLAATLAELRAAGLKVRPQFIRQPESERQDTRLLVAMAGQTVEFSGSGYGFLDQLKLADLLAQPGGLADAGKVLNEPRYLVCTNGQRDLCCARFGLPTYNALRERLGDRVWQATHLGGHRFAPNVLTLPDACLYGRVDVDGVDGFLGWTESGAVDFQRLRGRSAYPAVVQAAEACLGRQQLRLLHVDGDEQGATVRFAAGAEQLSVKIGRSKQALAVTKSCGDEAPALLYPFVENASD